MKNLVYESVDPYVLDEGRFGKALATAGLGAALAFGSPAYGQNYTKGDLYSLTQTIMKNKEMDKGTAERIAKYHLEHGTAHLLDTKPKSTSPPSKTSTLPSSPEELLKTDQEMYSRWIGAKSQDKSLDFKDWIVQYDILTRVVENPQTDIRSINDYQKGDILVHSSAYDDREIKEQIMFLSKNQIAAGHYQVQGTNQILTGLGIQVVGAGITLIGMQSKNPETIKNTTLAGVLVGAVGLGFEIGGIVSLRKAGLALNPKGLTFTYNF